MTKTLVLDFMDSEFSIRVDTASRHFSEDDFGFSERFVRKLFYDNAHCLHRYFTDIRPNIPGAPRRQAANALDRAIVTHTDDSIEIEGQQVMQRWEAPLMRAMVQAACRPGDSVLEVGFGLGLSATEIQKCRPAKHTIIEASAEIAREAREWRKKHGRSEIEIIEARWEHAELPSSAFDAVFFDTYPSDEAEIARNLELGRKDAEKFFPIAERVIVPGGRFTFYTGAEIGLLMRVQDALFTSFGTLHLERVSGLVPPPDCNYWIAPQMVVVVAEKRRSLSCQ